MFKYWISDEFRYVKTIKPIDRQMDTVPEIADLYDLGKTQRNINGDNDWTKNNKTGYEPQEPFEGNLTHVGYDISEHDKYTNMGVRRKAKSEGLHSASGLNNPTITYEQLETEADITMSDSVKSTAIYVECEVTKWDTYRKTGIATKGSEQAKVNIRDIVYCKSIYI